KGWSNQELSEFYRILDILDKAGVAVESDQGLSDEGDPWFVFCHRDKSQVVAHFARIDGVFYSISGFSQSIYKGSDIRQVVDQMLASHPLMVPRVDGNSRLFMHPSAVLTAFVVASFFLTVDEARSKDLQSLFGQLSDSSEFLSARITEGTASYGERKDNDNQNQVRGGFLDGFAALGQSALLGAVMIIHKIMSEDPSGANVFSSSAVWGIDYSSSEYISEPEELFSKPYLKDPTYSPEYQGNNLTTVSLGLDDSSTMLDKDTGDTKDIEQERGINLFRSSMEVVETDGGFLGDARALDIKEQTVAVDLKEQSFLDVLISSSFVPSDDYYSLENNHQLKSVAEEKIKFNDSLLALSVLNNGGSNLDGFSVSIDLGGKPSLIGLSSSFVGLNSSSSFKLFDQMEVRSPHGREGLNEGSTPLSSNKHQDVQETIQMGVPNQDQVVRGHALWRHPSETVALSKDVDVVFYDGGDKEVKSFELGKDLLWFFLEPGVIEQAKVSVRNEVDLQLDFGDAGLLTFVDILESNQFDFFI
ncbi:hypothetical protein OAN59_10815, partial [Alphaproteobacteria bacterium]|nr:hypothetical protein [Alphaproteobacteria bacterium]